MELCSDPESVAWAGVVQGLTADKDDEEIEFDNHIKHFQKYHGMRQTVQLADRGDSLCWVVVPLNSEIPVDPTMLSGKYSKKVNYVSVADEVLIDVQPDYSFHITEHTSSIIKAVQALQDSVNALLGQSHSHP